MPVRTDYFPSLTSENLGDTNTTVLVNKERTLAAPTLDHLIFFNEADFFSEKLHVTKCTAVKT